MRHIFVLVVHSKILSKRWYPHVLVTTYFYILSNVHKFLLRFHPTTESEQKMRAYVHVFNKVLPLLLQLSLMNEGSKKKTGRIAFPSYSFSFNTGTDLEECRIVGSKYYLTKIPLAHTIRHSMKTQEILGIVSYSFQFHMKYGLKRIENACSSSSRIL